MTPEHTPLPEALQVASPALGRPGAYYLVQGEPSVPRKDLHIDKATFDGLVEFVKVRKDEILDPAVACDSHLTVCERTQTIELVLGEHGGFKHERDAIAPTHYVPSNKVTAVAEFSKDHNTVLALLSGRYEADKLAAKIRTLRHLFATKTEHEQLVKVLRSTQHKVERIVESTSNDLGARKKGFDEQIVNAEMIAFELRYAIYEGEEPQKVMVEVVYSIEGGNVILSLLSLDLELDVRDAVKQMIARTVQSIREMVGNALPIIRLN
jgi:hypothetical protein